MALAVVFFTCIDASAKWLTIADIPVTQIAFARYAGHLIYTLVLYLPQEGVSIFKSNAPGKQFLRSSFLLLGTFLNFQALKYLPITVTTTIMFASPIVITLLAVPLGLMKFRDNEILPGYSATPSLISRTCNF